MRTRYVQFLKAVLVLFGVGLALFAVFLLPVFAERAARYYAELAYLKLPILIFVYCTAVPFYAALHQGVRICDSILKTDPFSRENQKAFSRAGFCALFASIMYAVGTAVMAALQVQRPIVYAVGILIACCAMIVALLCAVLNQLLARAIELREENELTV